MEMMVHEYEKKHLRAVREHLAECTMFLRRNEDFPLVGTCDIALFGSGARKTIPGGTGSGEVNSRFRINIEQGLTNAGFHVTTEDWLDSYDNVYTEAKEKFYKEIRERARKNHTMAFMESMGATMPEPEHHLPLEGEGAVAIYVLSRNSGEGTDRKPIPGDIYLNETEKRDILRLQAMYPRFLLVLNVGGPVDLSELDCVENILLLSQLGVETGTCLADILLGKAFPSGKLATTWADWTDYPEIDFGDRDNTRYTEGVYVGYRYFDSVGKQARFPFGFGLGYTEFAIAEQGVFLDGENVGVECDVTNVGHFPGKEVVQLYVSVPSGRLDQPFQTLAAWVKTEELAPGETQMLSLRFAMSELASYDTEREQYVLEQGNYILRLGNSSVDTNVCGMVRVMDTIVVREVRNSLGTTDFEDFKPTAEESEDAVISAELPEELWGICVLELDPAAIDTEVVEYDQPEEMDPTVAQFTDEELIFMNIGAFEFGGVAGGVVGNAGKKVAGTAGDTTHALEDKGVPVLVMADGPAGLRLSKDYYRDAKGAHAFGSGFPESMNDLMPAPVRFWQKQQERIRRARHKVQHQYCTAIPIGTAIAQSWNLAFAELCGDIVGDEMERMGVHLWLAPALNIHRSIRCGRNFEYYSEDPVISGRMAAAMTLGVQVHPGCGVTIKHYACNNQETARYVNNSIVSERALREIYLKGFGICVREAQPKAVMTSYNLINGTHTSEHRGLITDILRAEFGFEGIVMTDWVIAGFADKNAQYGEPKAHRVAMAGNDLFMPGSKAEFKEMQDALESKDLSSEQLAFNAGRVYRLAKELVEAHR